MFLYLNDIAVSLSKQNLKPQHIIAHKTLMTSFGTAFAELPLAIEERGQLTGLRTQKEIFPSPTVGSLSYNNIRFEDKAANA